MKNKLIIIAIAVFILFSIGINMKIIGILSEVRGLSDKYNLKAGEESNRSLHFVLIAPDKYSYAWKLIKMGALDTAEKEKAILETIEVESFDVEEQVKEMEIAIAAKVDGIIVDPQNNEVFKSLIDKASEKGISVVTMNSNPKDNKNIITISNNCKKEGINAAGIVAKGINNSGRVLIVQEERDDIGLQQELERVAGFTETMKNFAGISIDNVTIKDIHSAQGMEQLGQIISDKQAFDAIFTTEQEVTVGVAQTIESMSKSKSIFFVGVGDGSQIFNYIRNGVINVSFIQDSFSMGQLSIKELIKTRENKMTGQETLTDPIMINDENVNSFIR